MSDDQLLSTMVAGRYRLERQLAVGGMATVHRAQDTVLERPVAIKLLHDQFAADDAFVTRFKREAQAAARLGHPKVVAIYDWGPHGKTFYIAMELIEGRTLADELAETGPLSIDAALDVAIDVASALGAAHDQGTVHRDVKPSNIILGPSGGAKVADFGIARALQSQGDGDLTDAGSVIGTAGYLSPEQARGVPVDPRSDLYSLGVVLYEMVAGRRPFTGSSPMAVLHQHLDDDPPSVRELRPSVPTELEVLIAELLSKDPNDRPSTAAGLANRLRTIRADGPRQPPPVADSSDVTAVMAPTTVEPSGPQRDDLPPTAVMPPNVRPDARSEAATPPSATATRGSRSGWPVVVGAIAVVGVVALLLLASQTISGDDSDGSTDSTEPPATETTPPPPSTEDPAGEAVAVPDVRGASQEDAEAAIGDAGLVPVVETAELAGDDDRVGRVISQSPDPGQELQAGQQVVIVVGVAAETTTTTAQSTTTTQPTTTQPAKTQPPTTLASTTQPATSSTSSG